MYSEVVKIILVQFFNKKNPDNYRDFSRLIALQLEI